MWSRERKLAWGGALTVLSVLCVSIWYMTGITVNTTDIHGITVEVSGYVIDWEDVKPNGSVTTLTLE